MNSSSEIFDHDQTELQANPDVNTERGFNGEISIAIEATDHGAEFS